MLEVKRLSKSFLGNKVVDQVDLSIRSGDLISIIGPSGCGKSTLLRCLNGLEGIDEGEVHFIGDVLRSPVDMGEKAYRGMTQRWRSSIGMVFQSFNLFTHMNVIENLEIAPKLVKHENAELIRRRAQALLEKVGLSHHASRYPDNLSGGEQQRAAIARALMMQPKLMLYDEPTSALDPTLVGEVLAVMKQLDQEGMTQVVVTHEMRFARDVSDRVVFMKSGRVVEAGSPGQMFSEPKQSATQEYLRHFL